MNSEVKRCSVNTRSEMVSDAERVLSLAKTVARQRSLAEPRSLAAKEVAGDSVLPVIRRES